MNVSFREKPGSVNLAKLYSDEQSKADKEFEESVTKFVERVKERLDVIPEVLDTSVNLYFREAPGVKWAHVILELFVSVKGNVLTWFPHFIVAEGKPKGGRYLLLPTFSRDVAFYALSKIVTAPFPGIIVNRKRFKLLSRVYEELIDAGLKENMSVKVEHFLPYLPFSPFFADVRRKFLKTDSLREYTFDVDGVTKSALPYLPSCYAVYRILTENRIPRKNVSWLRKDWEMPPKLESDTLRLVSKIYSVARRTGTCYVVVGKSTVECVYNALKSETVTLPLSLPHFDTYDAEEVMLNVVPILQKYDW